MTAETKAASAANETSERRERAVVHSALWAAAGDALGWITELSRGSSGVARRAGVPTVTEPIEWRRVVGGRTGPRVNLPAGTYSDDTQLRLAVSRSIRGDGSFDAETFAKVEVTVWPSYSLGGGLGTKAAAKNLSRRNVNWFSNFFDSAGLKYVDGGGNGAAMRIQPHVWCSLRTSDELILNVMRDALVTHGHPHGFCGAVFHALSLAHAIQYAEIPQPDMWIGYVDRFKDLIRLITLDPQLAAFWQSTWESNSGRPVDVAIEKMIAEAKSDLDAISQTLKSQGPGSYHNVIERLGCLTPKFRGSGFKTALAALALAHLYRDGDPRSALAAAANELESDTDTIATMAGALLGAVSPHPPDWRIQDRDYIVQEARRLVAVSLGHPRDSFTYPDLGHWNPPATQTASIGWFDGKLAMVGLGLLAPQGKEYHSGDAVWQWFSLPFGQTILAKRKSDLKKEVSSSQLPGPPQPGRVPNPVTAISKRDNSSQTRLPFAENPQERDERFSRPQFPHSGSRPLRDVIDMWTDEAIQADFDDATLGRLLNRCIDQLQSIDTAVGFAAIIAKAKLTRQRRRR